MESTGPTGTGPTGETGTGPTGETGYTGMEYMMIAPTEPPPDILSLDDILNDTSVKQVKEEEDKQVLLSIGSQSTQALRPSLLQWAKQGFPAAFPIMTLAIQPPTLCSDGECRCLAEYIEFCSGKTLLDHVQELQAKLVGMSVGFVNMGSYLNIVVSKD